MEDQSKEDQIRAKQAISPHGLGNQSVEGNSGPGAELPDEDVPDVPVSELEENYTDGEGNPDGVPQTHPNRHGDKPQLDRPSYGGGH